MNEMKSNQSNRASKYGMKYVAVSWSLRPDVHIVVCKACNGEYDKLATKCPCIKTKTESEFLVRTPMGVSTEAESLPHEEQVSSFMSHEQFVQGMDAMIMKMYGDQV